MDDVPHVVPIVLFLLVEGEHKPTIIGGAFGEVVAHESR